MIWSSNSRRTLPTQRSAVPFCQGLRMLVRIGLRALDFRKCEHLISELGVMVKQDVSIGHWQRECFAQLLHDPIACWMERNIEVQNAPATMFDNEEAVQSAEIKVGNGEEVERGNGFAMVVQKSEPLSWPCFPPGCALGVADSATRSVRRCRNRAVAVPHGCEAHPNLDFPFSFGGLNVGLLPPPSAFPLAAGGIAISRTTGIRPDAKRRPYLV